MTLTDSSFEHVTASASPDIYSAAVTATGDVELLRSEVADNVNTGGLYSTADVSLTDSTTARNGRQGGAAGGVWADGDLTILRSTVVGNNTGGTSNYPGDWGDVGGANALGTATITDSDVGGNTGVVGGVGQAGIGGNGPVVVVGSRIHDNHGGIGGGLAGHSLDVRRSTVDSNHAELGAGITGAGHIEDSTVADNHAVDFDPGGGGLAGGGMYLQGPTELLRTTVTGNTAGTGSALIFDSIDAAPHLEVTDSTISGNPLDVVDGFPTEPRGEILRPSETTRHHPRRPLGHRDDWGPGLRAWQHHCRVGSGYTSGRTTPVVCLRRGATS